MSITLQRLADLVHGKIQGDGSQIIHAARPVAEVREGDLTFLESEKYLTQVLASAATAVLVREGVQIPGKATVSVKDPLEAFVVVFKHLHGLPAEPVHGIDPKAHVHATAQVGPEASIHPFASIGEGAVLGARCRIHSGAVVGRFCKLGDDVVLYPNAVLYEDTYLGDRVIIHANAVIGADGFGYRLQNGRHVKIPQLGRVEIASDVEVGACATVDRGTFMPTRVGEGSKFDNLVQIAHNVQIGKHNIFASQVGVAGSSSTGDYVVLAGQAGIADHVRVGSHVVVGAKSGVMRDASDGSRLLGAPARPEREEKKILMSLDKIPDLRKDVKKLKQHLGLDEGEDREAA